MAAMTAIVRAAIRGALDPDPRPDPAPGDRLAAVLALLSERPEPSLLFTERTATMSRHPGEISFPGGLQDPEDADLASTALREANEELGLDPSTLDVLGALPPVHTHVSGILVTPFVAAIEGYPTFTISDVEIERLITVRVSELADAERERELVRAGGRVWRGWSYDVDGATIWGATGAMLHAFLEIVRKEAAWLMRP